VLRSVAMDDENSINGEVTLRGCNATPALGRIDQYELVRELGGGGFGCVYLARDAVAGIDVAVKGLPPEVKHNKEELENIRENFALVSRLHHPNIAAALVLHPVRSAVYSLADVRAKLRVFEGDALMVMEYAPGTTLSGWAKQFPDRRVPLDAALDIVRQIALALDYAHDRKILHRDIKPANVMVEPREYGTCSVKVLDFGLAAEIRSSMGRISREIHDTSGTRPYMAPEQWSGESQGPATDQYALAVLLHELLTGSVPYQSAFDTGDPVVMMANVLHQPVRMSEAVPAGLRKPLSRALSKKPSARYASCSDFVSAASRKSFPCFAVSFGILLALILCSVGLWRLVLVPHERERQQAMAAAALAESNRLEQVEAEQRKAEAERQMAAAALAESNRLAQVEAERQREVEAEQRKAEAERQMAAAALAESNQLAQVKAERQRKVDAEQRKAEAERQMAAAALAESNRLAQVEAERQRQAKAARDKIEEARRARQDLLQRLANGSEFVPADPKRLAGVERRVALPNGVFMEFVWCPPGRFLMGSPESEEMRNPDETLHLVTLTKGFWIGRTEVTRAQWKAVMGSAGFVWSSLLGADGAYPVDTVSWNQCREFCSKMGADFRLPTEAEWEYACRAGTSAPFSFGSALNGDKANCSGGAEPYGTLVSGPNSFGSKRVKSYARNPWGLYDMHGNLFEWCADGYADYPTEDVADPQGDPSSATRIVRGGCWNFKPKMCRSAFRSRKDPTSADSQTGFRVCCDRLPERF